MFNRIITWARAHQNMLLYIGAGLAIIICYIVWSAMFSSTPTGQPTPQPGQAQPLAPAAGWHFLKLAFLTLIGLAYASRATRKSYYFGGMAVLLLLILIGKFNSLFSWTTIGLPALAAMGIWGMAQIDATTNGRMKSFLGFSSGIVILWWMYLFYIAHPIEEVEYINGVFCSDNTARVALVIFIGTTIFATWKRSKFFYGVAIVAFLVFLGNDKVNDMYNRFPEKFTPSVSKKTKNTWENVWDSVLRGVNSAVAPTPTPTPQPTQAPASISASAPTSQTVPAAKSVAQPTSGKIDRYVIPTIGTPPYSEIIQVGGWNVFPLGTTVMEIWENKPRATNGSMVVLKETKQCFSPPPGTKEVILTRK